MLSITPREREFHIPISLMRTARHSNCIIGYGHHSQHLNPSGVTLKFFFLTQGTSHGYKICPLSRDAHREQVQEIQCMST